MASLAELAKATAPREVELPQALSLEEIFSKIEARKEAFQMPFEIKNGVTGEHISFKKVPALDVALNVSVKENTLKVSPVIKESGSSVSVGGMKIPNGNNSMQLPLKRGEYIDAVTDTIVKILNGEPVEDYVAPEVPVIQPAGKSWTTLLLLTIFGGGVGAHRFYVNKVGTGILYLCTGACCGIGWIIDIIKVLTGKFEDKNGNVIQK